MLRFRDPDSSDVLAASGSRYGMTRERVRQIWKAFEEQLKRGCAGDWRPKYMRRLTYERLKRSHPESYPRPLDAGPVL